jgi:hypothetical protein
MSNTSPTYNPETDEQVIAPTITPAVKLDEKLKDELLTQIQEEGMIIVYCSFTTDFEVGIRIWNSTVLIDQQSGNRSRLLHALDITIAPVWMWVQEGTTVRFTLIFAPLPKTCELFTLWEDIPESGGFEIRNIKRNRSDVYHVDIM